MLADPRNDGTAPWLGGWGTGWVWLDPSPLGNAPTSIVINNGATRRELGPAEELAERRRRDEHRRVVTEEAVDRICRVLRRLLPRAPSLPVFDLRPARACALAGSWRAQGPP